MTAQRNYRLLVASLALLAALAELQMGRFDIPVSVRPVPIVKETCSFSRFDGPVRCELSEDWRSLPQGWQLPADRSGHLLVRVDVPVRSGLSRWVFRDQDSREGRLLLSVEGKAGTDVGASIHVPARGPDGRPVLHAYPFDGIRTEVPVEWERGEPVQVRLDWGPTVRASEVGPIRLSRVHVKLQAAPPSVPNVAIASLLVLATLLAFRLRETAGAKTAAAYALSVLWAMVVLLEALAQNRPPAGGQVFWETFVTIDRSFDAYLVIPYLVLLGLLGWRGSAGAASAVVRDSLTRYALAGALVWGLSRRLVAFAQAVPMKLDPDALGYMQIAGSLTAPYETHLREPLWVWVVHLWLGAAGWNEPTLRLLTVLCSMLVIWLSYGLFRDFTRKPLLGVLVAWLLADHDYLIQLSVRGLREEAYTAALLAVVHVVLVRHERLSLAPQAAWLAVAGAAAQLLRFTSHVAVIPLVLLWGWREGSRSWRYLLCVLLAIGAVSAPHAIHNARAFGDPLYSINVHASWFRNHELVVQKGLACEGCPSRAEIAADPYAGPPVTAGDYLFGLHDWKEIAGDTLEGYRRMYMVPTDLFLTQSGTRSAVGYGLFLIGLAAMLTGPYRTMVLVVPLLANLLPFLMLRDADPRLAVHTAPFVTFILAYGGWWTAERLLALPAAVERVCPPLARIRVEWPRGRASRAMDGERVVCR